MEIRIRSIELQFNFKVQSLEREIEDLCHTLRSIFLNLEFGN